MNVRLRLRQSVVVATIVLSACDGGRIGAPLGTSTTGTSSSGSSTAAGLVGTWRRILFFFAEDGSAGSNETTWRFDAGGIASRVTVTRNFTAGIADAQTVSARWEALPQAVRVTFLPPSSGTFDFSFRISSDTLYLASQAYVRVSR